MSTIIEFALAEWGEAERAGTAVNPRIIEYLKTVGLGQLGDGEPWCGAFAAWCAVRASIVPPSFPAVARSWLSVGQSVTSPRVGDIVVFRRGASWEGHVAFYIRHSPDKRHVLTLGGNQGDKVGINEYEAEDVLGFRRTGEGR